MKIAAIGSSAIELDFVCLATLSKFAREGHEVHIIVAKDCNDYTADLTENEARNSFERLGLTQIHFINERLDCSAITQENANVLNFHMKRIRPSVVIIPFWKSANYKRKTLSRTALIACRGIGSVLMYEMDKNANFAPNVHFVVTAGEVIIKSQAMNLIKREDDIHISTDSSLNLKVPQIQEISGRKSNRYTNTTDISNSYCYNDNDNAVAVESFESHRILLLDESWL